MAVPHLSGARALRASLHLPDGIVVHSEGVRRVAVQAARLVAAAGIPVDEPLVEAAALLHDIDKPQVRRTGGVHGVVGAAQLSKLGYPELAMPIASHPLSSLLDEERFPRGWPSVLVAVADRHVARGFCSVDERLDDMARRHPDYAAQIEAARGAAHALEAEVAEAAGLTIEELVGRLRMAWEAEA